MDSPLIVPSQFLRYAAARPLFGAWPTLLMLLSSLGKRFGVPRVCYAIVLMACSATVLLTLVSRLHISSVWDDAFFFVRYADNWIRDGKIAWNPGGETAYGLTSLAYLMVVLPVRIVMTQPAAAASVASQVSGLIWLGLLGLLTWRVTQGHALARRVSIALLAFAVTYSISPLASHFASGMDTTFALAFVTAYLLLLIRAAQTESMRDALIVAAWSGLTWIVRPDFLVFACGVPAVMLVLAPNSLARRRAGLGLMVTVLMTVSLVAMARAYFGEPFPLPFYAKSQRLYGDSMYAQYDWVALRFFTGYLASYWFLYFIIGVDLFWAPRAWWREAPAFHKGLLASTLVFTAYHTFFVLPVMGMEARFLYPTLPAIWLLSLFAIRRLIGRVPSTQMQMAGGFSGKFWIAVAIFLLCCLTPRALVTANALRRMVSADRLGIFSNYEFFSESYLRNRWFQLPQFSTLPDSLVIATTEAGMPAAFNPRKVIVDLAGLNTADFAHPPFSAAILFSKYHPDLIYLPHPHYREMIAAITSAPQFQQRYDYWDEAELGGVLMGVAIWRDSPHYAAMRKIVEESLAQQKLGRQ